MIRKIKQTETEYLLNICNSLLHTNIIHKKTIHKLRNLVLHHNHTKGVMSYCLQELDKMNYKYSL